MTNCWRWMGDTPGSTTRNSLCTPPPAAPPLLSWLNPLFSSHESKSLSVRRRLSTLGHDSLAAHARCASPVGGGQRFPFHPESPPQTRRRRRRSPDGGNHRGRRKLSSFL